MPIGSLIVLRLDLNVLLVEFSLNVMGTIIVLDIFQLKKRLRYFLRKTDSVCLYSLRIGLHVRRTR